MTTKVGFIEAASHALQNGPQLFARVEDGGVVIGGGGGEVVPDSTGLYAVCLLYTSDAADDTPCVDLGGRRGACLLYTSPSPRDQRGSRMPSSA